MDRSRERTATRERRSKTLSVDVAIRLDPASSTTEEAGFFGAAPERMFGGFVLPTRPAGAVLISSSLYAEQARNYRREVILARALARRGIASFHYHYRGTGHSDGDAAALTFGSMVADAREAVGILRERVGDVSLGFIGTRLGGYVAASMAGEAPHAPLAL
jgi:alpha-beta hydrolase superfamily lysophospholipase